MSPNIPFFLFEGIPKPLYSATDTDICNLKILHQYKMHHKRDKVWIWRGSTAPLTQTDLSLFYRQSKYFSTFLNDTVSQSSAICKRFSLFTFPNWIPQLWNKNKQNNNLLIIKNFSKGPNISSNNYSNIEKGICHNFQVYHNILI